MIFLVSQPFQTSSLNSIRKVGELQVAPGTLLVID